jgi:DNA invertase Pin-like site-specific DNA recombinase
MTTQRFGYLRVSTDQQVLDAQLDALQRAGVHEVFSEKMSGTIASRPELDKLRAKLRQGDTLVVTRLDRLGRSTKDLLNILSELEEKSVVLEVLEQKIDTSTPEGKLFYTLIAAFSAFEADILRARTKEGLASARARGRVGGRPEKLAETQRRQMLKLYDSQDLSAAEIASMFGISRGTLYRYVRLRANPVLAA